jgi:hypothetical protein
MSLLLGLCGMTSSTRGDVIERAINIEWMVNCLLSQHYLGRVSSGFVLQFLYDESCTFGLKVNVLLKVFPSLTANGFDQRLRRLNRIRNYFAHCGQILGDMDTGIEGVPDPKKPSAHIDFAALNDEFTLLEREVFATLDRLCNESGIALGEDVQGKFLGVTLP